MRPYYHPAKELSYSAVCCNQDLDNEALPTCDHKRLCLDSRECPLLAAVSMGRRNTRLKPCCLVFGPAGFAGAFEELAQQLLPMSERIPR